MHFDFVTIAVIGLILLLALIGWSRGAFYNHQVNILKQSFKDAIAKTFNSTVEHQFALGFIKEQFNKLDNEVYPNHLDVINRIVVEVEESIKDEQIKPIVQIQLKTTLELLYEFRRQALYFYNQQPVLFERYTRANVYSLF